jgi:hypothetical protein
MCYLSDVPVFIACQYHFLVHTTFSCHCPIPGYVSLCLCHMPCKIPLSVTVTYQAMFVTVTYPAFALCHCHNPIRRCFSPSLSHRRLFRSLSLSHCHIQGNASLSRSYTRLCLCHSLIAGYILLYHCYAPGYVFS